MAFGLVAASCTKSDFDNVAYMDTVKENYNDLFTLTFGEIAPGHDWGFSASTGNRAAMRAAYTDKWTDTHSCTWANKLNFKTEAELEAEGAIKLDNEENRYFSDWDQKYYYNVPSGTVYYVSSEFEGELNLSGNINDGCSFYNYGIVTAINYVNYDGIVTFYNAGTMTNFWPSTAGPHIVVNTGTLTVCKYSNLAEIYNNGTLTLEREHNKDWTNEGGKLGTVDNKLSIFSTQPGVILMPDGGGHFDANLDVHNKISVTGDLEFQNKDQNGKEIKRYVCELEVTGELYLNKGALYTSAITAGSIKMNAFPLYLRQGAHVVVDKTFSIVESGSFVQGHTNSSALIEAGSFYFKNKNDLTHNFSDNIYFKVKDYIQIEGCYKNSHSDGSGQNHYYTNMDDYLANTEDEYDLVAGRLNAGNATGVPECGDAWTVGTPEEDNTIYGEKKRIIAEDLAAGQFNADFDFNDVVFDAQVNVVEVNGVPHYIGNVEILAAGGTLPLYIGIPLGSTFDDNHEVHKLFGKNTGTMINTGKDYGDIVGTTPKLEIDLGPVGDGNTDADALVKKINDIPVVVVSSVRGAYELTTKIGTGGKEDYKINAPMKIAVPTTYKWTKERKEISTAYPEFPAYVQKKDPQKWYENVEDSDLLYK